ncbi:PEP-CTERM sorting domain-containing protein [Verrucomicrobium sp. BvORR034]|uniref:PEP-CTERM sorting domain-containing protein n=1 Tax=Verrucomicrobium sp. BvORR034 TaxID=1396418 RepID=UPI002240F322|nr:PEP-CTERM sorting domain-containing protein [Verrucomicrobium sp. BvORR034]
MASNTGFGINDNAIHTASLTVTRTSSTVMGLSLTVDGTTITASDTSTLITSFDEIAFANGFSTTGLDFLLDSVVVTSSVPEPSLVSLSVLALSCLVLCRRRSSTRVSC